MPHPMVRDFGLDTIQYQHSKLIFVPKAGTDHKAVDAHGKPSIVHCPPFNLASTCRL